MCTVLSTEALQALTGETISAATPNSGEFVYGPYCDYLSDKSGLFMTISSYSPADWATYTESQVAQGGTVDLPGVGDKAILDAETDINNSIVYVLAGYCAFSVQVTSMTDNGWDPGDHHPDRHRRRQRDARRLTHETLGSPSVAQQLR